MQVNCRWSAIQHAFKERNLIIKYWLIIEFLFFSSPCSKPFPKIQTLEKIGDFFEISPPLRLHPEVSYLAPILRVYWKTQVDLFWPQRGRIFIENDDLKDIRPRLGSHIRTFEPFTINILSLWDNFLEQTKISSASFFRYSF